MAENPRIKQFPNYLLKATLGVGLHWDQTPDTYTYRVQLPTREWARIEYTTRQFQGDPHQIPQVADLPLYVLQLLDEQGRVLHEWTAHEDLPSLFEAARNSALKADETLDKVVESLKQLLERSRREAAGQR
jgi:hypothetical protein